PGRKIVANHADLFLYGVKVIYQPLRRRRYSALFADRLRDGAIGLQQHPAIVPQPCIQARAGLRFVRDTLGSSQTLGVLLEALHAKEFSSNRLFGILNGSLRQNPEGPSDRTPPI